MAFRDLLTVLRLAANSSTNDASSLYRLAGQARLVDPSAPFCCMGLWESGDDYRGACERLVREVLDGIGSKPKFILDVGCGFGAATSYMHRLYPDATIIGVDILEEHVAFASKTVSSEKLAFELGNATSLNLESGTQDAVVSIESAQHFDTRLGFLREARRVLRSGGSLLMSDVLLSEGAMSSSREIGRLRRTFQIPGCNLWTAGEYAERLRGVGFGKVKVSDMTQKVLPGFIAYMRDIARNEDYRRRAGRFAASTWVKNTPPVAGLEYLIISAVAE